MCPVWTTGRRVVLLRPPKNCTFSTPSAVLIDVTNAPNGRDRTLEMSAAAGQLRRLQTGWIDLYQMHYPDPGTPIEETLSALSDLVHEGKVRYIGSSNMAPWQVVEAEWVSRTNGLVRFISALNGRA